MSQQLNLSGAVVVPHHKDLATADAQKGIAMFRKLQTPVLGLFENELLSIQFVRSSNPIFGCDGGHHITNTIALLGQMPPCAIQADADQDDPQSLKSDACFSKVPKGCAKNDVIFTSSYATSRTCVFLNKQ